MRKTAKIIHIDPNGPNGLQEWEQMDYKNLVSGTPVQRGHLYHEIQEQGYMVGVWDCTAFTDQMMPYSVDEYMLLLAGDVAMVMPDGTEVKINAGDAFVIPKGLKCQWKQNSFVHKIFMILDSPIGDAQNASLNRISVPDFDLGKSGTTLVKTRTEFLNAAGTMQVDVQLFAAMRQPRMKCRANLLISVLEGTLTLNDGVNEYRFSKGQTAYVQQGGSMGWSTSDGTKLISASFLNNPLNQS